MDSEVKHKIGSKDCIQCPGWQKTWVLASQGSGLGIGDGTSVHNQEEVNIHSGKMDGLSPHLEEFVFTKSHWLLKLKK